MHIELNVNLGFFCESVTIWNVICDNGKYCDVFVILLNAATCLPELISIADSINCNLPASRTEGYCNRGRKTWFNLSGAKFRQHHQPLWGKFCICRIRGAGAVALCMLQINYIPGSWELSPWFFATRLPRIFAISPAKQFAFNANMNKSVLIAKLGQQLFWSGLYLSY